jgi:hypothetical protein
LTPPSGLPQESVRGSWREFSFVVFVIFVLFVARFEIEDKKFSHKEHKVHKGTAVEHPDLSAFSFTLSTGRFSRRSHFTIFLSVIFLSVSQKTDESNHETREPHEN